MPQKNVPSNNTGSSNLLYKIKTTEEKTLFLEKYFCFGGHASRLFDISFEKGNITVHTCQSKDIHIMPDLLFMLRTSYYTELYWQVFMLIGTAVNVVVGTTRRRVSAEESFQFFFRDYHWNEAFDDVNTRPYLELRIDLNAFTRNKYCTARRVITINHPISRYLAHPGERRIRGTCISPPPGGKGGGGAAQQYSLWLFGTDFLLWLNGFLPIHLSFRAP